MSDLPDPLTAPDCDLRGYEYMPLFGNRLFSSGFYARATDAEFRAAMRLWWAAWQQCPAGSLPDDDRVLALLADFGRDIRRFRKVREVALHGFIKCNDGRLYHKLICNEAQEAYEARKRERMRKAIFRAKNTKQYEPDPSESNGLDGSVPRDTTGTSADGDGDVRCERRGEERREEREERGSLRSPSGVRAEGESPRQKSMPPEARALDAAFERFYGAYPLRTRKGAARREFLLAVQRGVDPAEIIAGLEASLALGLFVFRQNGDFLPYPASWLRDEGWTDALQPPPEIPAAGKRH